MGFSALTHSFPWNLYSKKLSAKIDNPRSAGIFTEEEAQERDMRLAVGLDGNVEDGNAVQFFWLVDKDDGIIVDVKFQAFGQSALIGAAEVASELLVGKNYDQALRITADLIDKQVRDRENDPAFPKETYPHLNLVLGAIENASEKCTDLPLPEAYASSACAQRYRRSGGGWLSGLVGAAAQKEASCDRRGFGS